MQRTKSGFTIVELLIVIVVIAILAAISIVAYIGIQNQARASSAKGALTQASTKLATYQVSNGQFPPDQASLLAELGTSSGVDYQYTVNNATNPQTYCITATAGTVSYYLNSATTNTPTQGGCAGHGQGGQSAITNLAVNPESTAYNSTQSQFGWRSDRYGADGTYSVVTGAGDGPLASITTYARYTFTNAVGASRGFHNVGNPEGASPSANGGPVTAGTTYTFSAYFRSSDGQGTVTMGVRFSDGTNWVSTNTSGAAPSLSGGGWVRASVTATAPTGATKAHLYIRQTGTVPNHTVGDRLDGTGLMVTEESTLYNFADGSSPSWVWNGSANAATSTGPPV